MPIIFNPVTFWGDLTASQYLNFIENLRLEPMGKNTGVLYFADMYDRAIDNLVTHSFAGHVPRDGDYFQLIQIEYPEKSLAVMELFVRKGEPPRIPETDNDPIPAQ